MPFKHIKFSDRVLDMGLLRSKELDISLSAYIRLLVVLDNQHTEEGRRFIKFNDLRNLKG